MLWVYRLWKAEVKSNNFYVEFIDNQILTCKDFLIYLVQTEAIMSFQQLSLLSADSNDLEALRLLFFSEKYLIPICINIPN